MNYKKICIIFLVLFNLQLASSYAQTQNFVDSLKQVLSVAQKDTNKVKALNTLAIKYQKIDLDTSLFYAEQSLELAIALNYKIGIAKAYKVIGLVHYYHSDNKNALKNWQESLKMYEELGNRLGMASNYQGIGLVYKRRSNYPKALEYYKKAIKIFEEEGKKSGIAENLLNIAVVYRNQSNYSKALEYSQKALKINMELGRKSAIANNYQSMGIIYSIQSNYRKALEYFGEALEIKKEIGNKYGIAANLQNIGVVYHNQSNFPKALEYYQKSLKIKKEISNKLGISAAFGNIGIVYKEQSNLPKALEYYKKALTIKEELGDKTGVARNVGNIGNVYSKQNRQSEALEYYQKALKIFEEVGDESGIAANFQNIGSVYRKKSNYPKSLEYSKKALKINKELDNKLGIATNLGNIGQLYIYKQEYNKAVEYANKSLKIKQEIGLEETSQYINLSTSYWALNNKSEAASNFNKIADIDNRNILLNFSILPENAKQLYFAGIEQDYWQYNSFVLQNTDSFPNMVERVYNNTVKNKGLLLKSNTAMRNAIYSSNNSALLQEYDNWIVLKRQIVKKYSKGKAVTLLENKADSLEANLVKNSNEFSNFNKTQNINWKQVQKGLKENEIAIEFTHFPLINPDSSYTDFTNQIQYVALIVTHKSKYPEMIPLFEEKQLEQIIGKFGGNNYSYINGIYGKNTEVNQELYNLIWKPMEASLKGAKKIYLSPDGLLHKISFSAIAKEQNVYLCDAYDIEIKSTTGKITENQNSLSSGEGWREATLFGGINYDTDSTKQEVWKYLEGTKTETQKIDKILKRGKVKVNYYTNTSATEEEFKLMASNSNILHIATHGFFYPDPKDVQEETKEQLVSEEIVFRGGSRGFGVNSFVENYNPLMRSGLVFAGANDVWSRQNKGSVDDGVLTAQEVANIDMRKTDLVVMSACETGLGDIKGSEGVYGLQRAFKMAGVDNMIMSLWQVPDKETEEFMTVFYKKLIKQKDIKQSFAETQKEMRVKYDPYFWAAFVLIE